jgi:hypothetical protein
MQGKLNNTIRLSVWRVFGVFYQTMRSMSAIIRSHYYLLPLILNKQRLLLEN